MTSTAMEAVRKIVELINDKYLTCYVREDLPDEDSVCEHTVYIDVIIDGTLHNVQVSAIKFADVS